MLHIKTRTIGCLAGVLLLGLTSCKPPVPPTDLSKENIIPQPISITATGNAFVLTDDSDIYVEGPEELKQIGQYLADKLNPSTGFDMKVASTTGAPKSGNIHLTLSADPQLGEEGYELNITNNLLKLAANKPAGLFRGIQTLRQVLPAKIELSTHSMGRGKFQRA